MTLLPGTIERRSPNHNVRRANIWLVVIHGTAGRSDEGDLSWITNPASKVSYHDLIGRDGKIYNLVPYNLRAWHAGTSTWKGVAGCNDYSIGVAMSNNGVEQYTSQQYDSLGRLLAHYRRLYNIRLDDIVGHYHVSPGRKTDPYYTFQWTRAISLHYVYR